MNKPRTRPKREPASHGWPVGERILGCVEAALRFENTRKAGGLLDIGDDTLAFAVGATMRETAARGIAPLEALRKPQETALVWRRLCEYRLARLAWHLMLLRKEVPAGGHADTGIRDAAFAGWLASERKRQCDHPAVRSWLDGSKTAFPAAYRAFTRWLAAPQPARWKYPNLDSWLVLVWPMVLEFGWRFDTVHCLAAAKFPDADDALEVRK